MSYEENGNLKNRIINMPVRLNEIDFDNLYDEISNNWRDKAHKLQVRRMRKIKNKQV